MSPAWRVETRSGSIYEIRELAGEWRLRVATPPRLAGTADLRGLVTAIVRPIPWPPSVGEGLLILMQAGPGHVRLRMTTPVVRVDAGC